MLISDGYYIEHKKDDNKIIIGLPQTFETVSNTVSLLTDRKSDFTDGELYAILSVVKAIAGHNNVR